MILGLGMLYFSSFAKVKYTGPTIALSLAVALVAALTLAPALLAIFGRTIFWPFRAPHLSAAVESGDLESPKAQNGGRPAHGFWARVADLVVAQPLPILSVCLLVLLPLAVIGARAVSSYSQLSDLDPDTPSVVGTNTVRRYFAVGELSPAAALVHHPSIDFRSPEGRETIAELSRRLLAIGNIAEVRSLTQPLGKPPAAAANSGFLNRIAGSAVSLGAESRYVGTQPASPADRNHITRLDLVFKTDPFSEASLQSLEEVQATLRSASRPGEPLAGTATIGIAGSSSMLHDLKSVTGADQRRMYVLVTVGVYVILVVLLRRPGICLYLIATVVLGYLASLGLTDLLFRALHHGADPWIGLDWTVAFFLFVILVAVGEDYNIFLMARVIEEERSHGTIEGTRLAVAHTGGIISSCGLIMAGTFGSMLTGRLTSLRELGFALGLGVLLDTFLVRPILVPAFVVLLERIKRETARAAPWMSSLHWSPQANACPDVRRAVDAAQSRTIRIHVPTLRVGTLPPTLRGGLGGVHSGGRAPPHHGSEPAPPPVFSSPTATSAASSRSFLFVATNVSFLASPSPRDDGAHHILALEGVSEDFFAQRILDQVFDCAS